MPKTTEAPRPEHKTIAELRADLEEHLADLDREAERITKERMRIRVALDALADRRRPGRPAKL